MTKKQLIIDSAIELFAEKGIEATSVQQITAHCGISKGAFYLSFKSKDELVLAIIDYFMKNVIRQVDQAVSEVQNPEEKLYIYFVTTFNVLSQYTGFAEILMKEKLPSIGAEFMEKIMMYEQMSDKELQQLLSNLYGEQIDAIQYDLLLIIKCFIKSYSQILFSYDHTLNIPLLAKSLVEKTTILANHSTIIYLTKPMIPVTCAQLHFTKEEIINELTELIEFITNEVEQQSIELLIEELDNELPRQAILLGMVANIQHNQKAAWCSYMIKKYIDNLK